MKGGPNLDGSNGNGSSRQARLGPEVLYLARHGETDGGTILRGKRDGEPLSGLGVLQAIRLGRQIAEYGIGRAFASPLLDARQTVEIALLGKDLETTFRDGFAEADWGLLTGLPLEQARGLHGEILDAWTRGEDVAFPGGESTSEMKRRILGALDEVLAAEVRSVLVVTHAGPIKIILDTLLGPGYPGRLDRFVPEGSISAVELSLASRPRLLHLADTSHLSGLEILACIPSR